jgi:hypothetical protein
MEICFSMFASISNVNILFRLFSMIVRCIFYACQLLTSKVIDRICQLRLFVSTSLEINRNKYVIQQIDDNNNCLHRCRTSSMTDRLDTIDNVANNERVRQQMCIVRQETWLLSIDECFRKNKRILTR